jgi:hypothetical protein
VAFTDPARSTYLLLTFSVYTPNWFPGGEGTGAGELFYAARFTDWTEDVTLGSDTWKPWPALAVKIPPNTGSVGSKALSIEFPVLALTDPTDNVDKFWLPSMVSGEATPPVTLEVREIAVSRGTINTLGCVNGQGVSHGTYRLVRGARNASGQPGVGVLEFLPIKARLNGRLGIAAYPRCAWTFGDATCGIDVPELVETATIASISRKKITLTNPDDAAVVTSKGAGYWHRGLVGFDDGLAIGIRDWTDGSYEFELLREPPAAWEGALVTLRPGCDKTIAVCRSRWDNEERFGGFGISIPAFDPTAEIP